MLHSKVGKLGGIGEAVWQHSRLQGPKTVHCSQRSPKPLKNCICTVHRICTRSFPHFISRRSRPDVIVWLHLLEHQ